MSTSESLRDLFYNAPIPIAYLDPNGKFRKVNPAWAGFAGFSEDDLVDRLRIHEITHPQDVESNVKLMQKVLLHFRAHPTYISVSRFLSKDGKALWGQSFYSVITDEDGDAKQILLFVIPLPNHGKFKVTQHPDETFGPTANVTLRPSLSFGEFVKDNWKWVLTIGVTVLGFVIKMAFVLAEILHKVGMQWNEVLF